MRATVAGPPQDGCSPPRGAGAKRPGANMQVRTIKVVLAKPGLDGHDQGAKVVVRAMLDAGFDVHYTGLRQTPEQVVDAALREGADVIALSSMAGSHLPFCTRLKPLLEAAGLGNKLWVIGGNLPKQDHDALRALGFKGVFPTGSRLDDICDFIKANTP
jgi:methylmalonyl-CoA mutase, C-terminal domain